MNAPKNPMDLAPSTFARKRANGQLPWSMLNIETVERLRRRTDVSLGAKWTWVCLQGIARRSTVAGYFIESGAAMSTRDLAAYLGGRASKLERDINELLQAKFLKMDGELLFDPMMVLNHFPENLRNYRENSKQFQKILGNFPNQLSSFQDSSTGAENPERLNSEGFTQNGDSPKTEFNHPTAEESRIENTRFSTSTEAKASFAGGAASAPGGAAVPSTGGISDAEIAKLKRDPRYDGKDVDDVIRKCREHCAAKGEPMTLRRVRGWLKGEHTTSTSTPGPSKPGDSRKPSEADCNYPYELINKHAFKIRGMPPERKDGDYQEWMRLNVPGDYDPGDVWEDLFERLGLMGIFLPDEFETDWDENGHPIDGAEQMAAGSDHIGGYDERGAPRLKGSKWLVRVS
jgi:hypothetical protein